MSKKITDPKEIIKMIDRTAKRDYSNYSVGKNWLALSEEEKLKIVRTVDLD